VPSRFRERGGVHIFQLCVRLTARKETSTLLASCTRLTGRGIPLWEASDLASIRDPEGGTLRWDGASGEARSSGRALRWMADGLALLLDVGRRRYDCVGVVRHFDSGQELVGGTSAAAGGRRPHDFSALAFVDGSEEGMGKGSEVLRVSSHDMGSGSPRRFRAADLVRSFDFGRPGAFHVVCRTIRDVCVVSHDVVGAFRRRLQNDRRRETRRRGRNSSSASAGSGFRGDGKDDRGRGRRLPCSGKNRRRHGRFCAWASLLGEGARERMGPGRGDAEGSGVQRSPQHLHELLPLPRDEPRRAGERRGVGEEDERERRRHRRDQRAGGPRVERAVRPSEGRRVRGA
jgi:hypothetical protein